MTSLHPESSGPPLVRPGLIRLGMLGMVDGNGHPYSWSAIFNGYDPGEMAKCPYTGIPAYLNKEPMETMQILGARVPHVGPMIEGNTWSDEHVIVGDVTNRDCGYLSRVEWNNGTIVTAYYAASAAQHHRYHTDLALWAFAMMGAMHARRTA